MRKRETVEDDLSWGPIKEKEIFYKDYGFDREVHILVQVFKYRLFVCQFDTTSVIWDVVGESLHSIRVELSRNQLEKVFNLKDEDLIISAIEQKFPGPYSVDAFIAFCRENGFNFSIHEDGLARDNLILSIEK